MSAPKAVDVMGFAGGFAKGVEQAGFDIIAKREPAAFGGFGAGAFEVNMPQVQVEVSEPEFWSMVEADLVYGCPPCSGFSALSTVNKADSKTGIVGADGQRVDQRGVDSPINQWMHRLIEYAAKVQPSVVVMESVSAGGKMGAPLMRRLWQKMRETTGIDYQMTDVFLDNALIGGDCIRRRYFLVLHYGPFGVDLPKATPRSIREVIGDLPAELEPGDPDWGHVTGGSKEAARIAATIELFREHGYDWAQGKRLPEHMKYWYEEMGQEVPEWWFNAKGEMLSHAYSDNMYSPFRWRWEQPMGVVTGGFMDRAVHPVHPRLFTYREGARLMGLPDDWSLRPIVLGRNGPWLGKAITVAAGRWIATWAMNSITETPGEYAGVEVEPGHRVIDVDTADKVRRIEQGAPQSPDWWPDFEGRRPYFYDTPLGSRRSLPMQSNLPLSTPEEAPAPPAASQGAYVPQRIKQAPRSRAKLPRDETTGTRGPLPVDRLSSDEFLSLLGRHGLSRSQAAEALGVSASRVAEMAGTHRPGSWLARHRLPEVEAKLATFRSQTASGS